MNDFTKEELEEILFYAQAYWLTLTSISREKVEPKVIPLINKIHSMIDNYCEHKCKGNGECLMNVCERCARMT